MKRPKHRITSLLLTLTILGSSLVGCAEASQPNTNHEESQKTAEVYERQIRYYEDLVKDLQRQLLNEKEENYIAICEYKLQVESLEESVKALSEKIGYVSVGSDGKGSNEEAPERPNAPNTYEKQSDDAVPPEITELTAKSDYQYKQINGEIIITKYVGKDIHVTIPTLIDGSPVTAIDEGAFQGCEITEVILPATLRQIGWFAFSNCPALREITIPPSVTVIGYGTFDHCYPGLTVRCQKGSYAEAYSKSFALTVKAE